MDYGRWSVTIITANGHQNVLLIIIVLYEQFSRNHCEVLFIHLFTHSTNFFHKISIQCHSHPVPEESLPAPANLSGDRRTSHEEDDAPERGQELEQSWHRGEVVPGAADATDQRHHGSKAGGRPAAPRPQDGTILCLPRPDRQQVGHVPRGVVEHVGGDGANPLVCLSLLSDEAYEKRQTGLHFEGE